MTENAPNTPSLRRQAIDWITRRRDAEMAVAGVYADDQRYREIAAWHVGEAGAYQCVLDALTEAAGTPAKEDA